MKSIFISKEDLPDSFRSFCKQKKWTITAKSFISFKPINFSLPDTSTFDIICFTSPRCVQFFFEGIQGIPLHQKMVCIGQRTAEELESYGFQSSFTGEKSGQPEFVAKELAKYVAGRKVLFPQSNRSKQSMQKFIPSNNIIPLVIYETNFSPQSLEVKDVDLLVFTSPSNFESFLAKNTIAKNQRIIAWGETTAKIISNKGFNVFKTLKTSSFEELTEIVESFG